MKVFRLQLRKTHAHQARALSPGGRAFEKDHQHKRSCKGDDRWNPNIARTSQCGCEKIDDPYWRRSDKHKL
jgi:hypothetical protein